MLENMTAQQRLLFATIVSMIFFIGYSYMFAPKRVLTKTVDNNHSKIIKQTNQYQAPNIATSSTSTTSEAPSIPNSAPVINVSKEAELSAIAIIKTQDFTITIDKFGRISSKTLLAEKYKNNKSGISAQLVNQSAPKPLEIRFKNEKLNKEAFEIPYQTNKKVLDLGNSSETLILTQKLSTVTVTKEITFYKDGHYNLKINLSKPEQFFLSNGLRPNVAEYGFVIQGAMVKKSDGQIEIIEDGDAVGSSVFRGIFFVSSFDRYYASIFYNIDKNLNVVIESDKQENPMIFLEGMQNITLNGYLGAKDYKVLQSLENYLTDAIEYGWFTFIAKPIYLILQWLHSFVGNWGWSIVFLTLMIRLVLYPLTYKGMVSMQKLKDIAPNIKEIQRQYKSNPQQMQVKMMDLYKKHGANPMGGCLPMLLQIPVFFSIYRVLLNSVELQGEGWIFWIHDLAKMDPYFILPILMGGSMFLQQYITPSNFTDPIQEKIFKFLPLIFTFFFISFPAGLTLYWFINNLASILQQYVVNRQFKKIRELKAINSK